MRIESIELKSGAQAGYARISASITSPRWKSQPQRVWFEVPEELSSELSHEATPWLQLALPHAFQFGETLETNLEVDPQWLVNARSQMTIWHRWFPRLEPIEIEAPVAGGKSKTQPVSNRTALFFTAGVDSFYSLYKFDAEAKQSGRPLLNDLVYVCGYDIPLEKRDQLARKLTDLSEVVRQMNKKLVPLWTNLRQTRLNELDWGRFMHGPAFGTAGLLLESRWQQVLISAGGCIDDFTAWGSHPLTDPLMSTSRTQVIRYSNNTTRFAKTEYISQFDLALQRLHVCWIRNSNDNCGDCEKCIRTMLMLEVIGALPRASCFPPGDIMEKLRKVTVTNELAVPLWEDIKAPAIQRGRPDIAREIDLCLERSRSTMRRAAKMSVLRTVERKIRNVRKLWLG